MSPLGLTQSTMNTNNSSSGFIYSTNTASNKSFYNLSSSTLNLTSASSSVLNSYLNSDDVNITSVVVKGDKEDKYETSFASLFIPEEDRLLLYLRYYARHFIPIFCVVGIIGNCMALLLIRYFLHANKIKKI